MDYGTEEERAWSCQQEGPGEAYCPVCDEKDPEFFYFNQCSETIVGCGACVRQAEWHEAAGLLAQA
jgi:hypothetical protein